MINNVWRITMFKLFKRHNVRDLQDQIKAKDKEIEKLKHKLRIAKTCLRKYANKERWYKDLGEYNKSMYKDSLYYCIWCRDYAYESAQRALKKLGEEQ